MSEEKIEHIDVQKLILGGIDYDEGLRRFVNKADLYHKYLLKFCDDTKVSRLMDAVEEQDYKEAFALVHDLKGITGNLSLNHFYKNVCDLTEVLRTEPTGNVKQMVEKLNEEYEDIKSAITEVLG